ncbi:hypothetical protein FQR65_LT00955 [Abscondita terminalis]|nr:hypothetical protein FQR65_LT00955 [Abscondita terminalis]
MGLLSGKTKQWLKTQEQGCVCKLSKKLWDEACYVYVAKQFRDSKDGYRVYVTSGNKRDQYNTRRKKLKSEKSKTQANRISDHENKSASNNDDETKEPKFKLNFILKLIRLWHFSLEAYS